MDHACNQNAPKGPTPFFLFFCAVQIILALTVLFAGAAEYETMSIEALPAMNYTARCTVDLRATSAAEAKSVLSRLPAVCDQLAPLSSEIFYMVTGAQTPRGGRHPSDQQPGEAITDVVSDAVKGVDEFRVSLWVHVT